ncbi:MAG: hypothetical protein ABEJ04_00310 [Halobacteriaceae archaeon]
MSVTGVCQICESAEAVHACDRCGRVVCADHFDEAVGLCVECAAETGDRPERGERGRTRGDHPDDWGEPR